MTTARWCAVALLLVACDGSPGGGGVDATNDGDAGAPDAGGACVVTASLDLALPGQTLYWLELAPTPTGWLVVYGVIESMVVTARMAVVSSSGQVTMAPTLLGDGEPHVAVNGDRAMVTAGESMQVRGLDGSIAGPLLAVGGSRPGMTAQGVVAGPGDGFRVVRAALRPTAPGGRPSEVDVEIARHDRDGAFVSLGPTALVGAVGFDTALAYGAGEILAPYRSLHAIGGCFACSSGGVARFAPDGTVAAMDLVPVDSQHGAIIKDVSAAGDQVYLGWTLRGDPSLRVAGNVARSPTDTVHTVPEAALAVVATAPRAGLIGGDGSTRWLQRFDDSAGFALGARCELSISPWKLHARGSSVLVVDDTGRAQLVTAP